MDMLVVIAAAGLGFAYAAQLSSRWLSPVIQRLAAAVSVCGLAVGVMVSLALKMNLFSWLLALASIYGAVNAARLVERRMHDAYLRHAVMRSALWLGGLSSALFIGWLLTYRYILDIAYTNMLQIVAWLALAVSFGMLTTLVWRLATQKFRPGTRPLPDTELPTVTVAVPARNETDTMAVTLEAILASDYPKLEVLVLDDCSLDKTPEVIRSYAHAGVRFVQGEQPADEHWLHKNYAYEMLRTHAVGEYLLFCGADIHFEKQSIRQLVSRALESKAAMVSVLPRRLTMRPLDALIQPMRYWWQLAIPKEWAGRVPVLSSCWLVQRSALQKLGGFASVSRMITPEAFFARELHRAKSYRFVLGGAGLGIKSHKSLQDQYNTALRTRYAEVQRRPERVFGAAVFELFSLLAPAVLVARGLVIGADAAFWLGVAALGLLTATHVLIGSLMHSRAAWLALVNFPLVAAIEIALLNWSMLQYEFGTVEWKGRNVCLPVMHVVPRLPKD